MCKKKKRQISLIEEKWFHLDSLARENQVRNVSDLLNILIDEGKL